VGVKKKLSLPLSKPWEAHGSKQRIGKYDL